MPRPRVHLSTLLLATLIWAACCTANFLGRAEEKVRHRTNNGHFGAPGAQLYHSDSYFYRYHYYALGWPCTVTGNTPDYDNDAEAERSYRRYEVPSPEGKPKEHPDFRALYNAYDNWSTEQFRQLAPTLAAEFPELPSPLHRFRFLRWPENRNVHGNKISIAINAAVAFVASLAGAIIWQRRWVAKV